MKKIVCVFVLSVLTVSGTAQILNDLPIENTVSDFSAIDDQGSVWKSSYIKTGFLVVYFYPAAMTSGCTKQACAYRNDKASFDELGVTVVGVSGDEVKNLKHFKNSYHLNFALLSDSDGHISKTFGVPTNKGGSITREIAGENYVLVRGITTQRWTFVLDKDRKIIYKNTEVNAAEDSKKVKEAIENYIKG